jgi:hypothetical protein
MSHTKALQKYGYKAAYTNQIGSTSIYGATVDWMYYLDNQIEPIGVPIVLQTLKMTDHNGVLVTFQLR